ncbi:MAG: SOS response-associated peptidase [Clostridia bacterium]|nr:SOS response-associated peptidase [Clostridia bacterium]
MCGRFTLTIDREEFKRNFNYTLERFDYNPNYNIAPGQEVPVIYRMPGENEISVRKMRWGLVPRWAENKKLGYRLINARGETVDKKPAFRDAFSKRRCLVPADGFYEWRKNNGTKTPFRIMLPTGNPFAFAGLWEKWINPENEKEELYSFTIITTDAAASIREIHPRMPVMMVDEKIWGKWLDPGAEAETLKEILKPYEGELFYYEVSTLVNSPTNNFPEIIQPVKGGKAE